MSQQKIGIDGRQLSSSGGISTYVSNLVRHIPFLDPLCSDFPGNNLAWNLLRVPLTAVSRKWKLYHAPAYTAPLFSPCPVALSVHDISYLVKEEWYPYRLDSLRRFFYRASMKRSDRIIVPSLFSKAEIIRVNDFLEPKLRHVPLAVSGDFYPDPAAGDRVARKYSLPCQFILHVGDVHPRRNIRLLEEVAFEVNLPLVLIGRKLVPVELSRSTFRFESIPIEELRGFYSAAAVFVYPSEYEGFGLPLLESMACGLPVVAAKRASIPEVCGDSAVLVDPERELLCRGIEQALLTREVLIKSGFKQASQFSWEETARKTVEVYEELLV